MIQLAPKVLKKDEEDELLALQNQIDMQTTFASKVAKAQALWNNKGGSSGKKVFEKIADTLYEMCIYTGICNYCEQSEANDIEHIHPKSFFPSNTFKWDNYILACKQCNTGFKLDKAYVLNQSDDLIKLKRGNEPPFNRIAFINIRTENPADLMLLNPLTHKFEIYPGLNKSLSNKAKATLEILELNERDTLIAARKSAANHYYDSIERLIRIRNAPDKLTLEGLLRPHDNLFDMNKTLEQIKEEITLSFKNYITTYQHPSVWQTIKIVQSKTNKQWMKLFHELPEALGW